MSKEIATIMTENSGHCEEKTAKMTERNIHGKEIVMKMTKSYICKGIEKATKMAKSKKR